jgi:hypothetical protein
MSNGVQLGLLRGGWCAYALALCSGACSGETVDVGEVTRDLEAAPSRCTESTLVQGSVLIESQAQVDELEGCERIEGNLHVRPFDGADFRPLGALREVGGALELGRMTALDYLELPIEEQERFDEILEPELALLDAGWLTSLEGFENLELAGSLALSGVGAPDLGPLSNLFALTNGGVLQIGPCTNLLSLEGLEQLRGVVDLSLNCNSLTTLAGPRFGARMGNVIIEGTNITDLGTFAPEVVNELRIQGTAIENLDALSGLAFATSVDLFDNPSLIDVEALDALFDVGYLRIGNSPLLERVPELTSLSELHTLSIVGNASLTNFPSLPGVGPLIPDTEWGNLAAEDALRVRPDIIQVVGNPALETLVIPRGWLAVSYLEIAANDGLASIDLSSLHAAEQVAITANPALVSVNLGLLETADDLRIIDNPLLPLEPFDAVQTFRRIVQPGPLTPDPL